MNFKDGERVLCYHGPLIYEAKVVKSANFDDTDTPTGTIGPHYFVHYKGWKQTWDEWVGQSRLLKLSDENLNLQKTLSVAQKATSGTGTGTGTSHKASGSTSHAAGAGGSSRRDGGRKNDRKRGRDEDDGVKKPDMKLQVPDVLKVILVDDWEAVTKNNQLVPLPRSPNVQDILNEFKAHTLSLPQRPAHSETLLPTLLQGLQTYFDRSLGNALLYRFERAQYAAARRKWVNGQNVVVGKEKEMSLIYGGEHLLRLLVNLPTMVSHTTMDAESVKILKEFAIELMNYMIQEKDRIFTKEYESTSTQYENLSRI